MNQDRIQEIIKSLLVEIDGDADREGLKDTPRRVAKAYESILGGYSRSLDDEMTVFKNEEYDEMIYSGSIRFFSTCEHHLLPFYGKAHIAYIPGEKIAGLSKLARAVDIYARRLQNQERITAQVADELTRILQPRGVAVLLEGRHFCTMSRGIQQSDSAMKTFAFRGEFKTDNCLRDQFMSIIPNERL